MNAIKIPSKFVVQFARLLEVDRGGQPHYSASKVVAVFDSLEAARAIVAACSSGAAQILEVFDPIVVDGAGVKFLDPKVHPAVEPKPVRRPLKARKAA